MFIFIFHSAAGIESRPVAKGPLRPSQQLLRFQWDARSERELGRSLSAVHNAPVIFPRQRHFSRCPRHSNRVDSTWLTEIGADCLRSTTLNPAGSSNNAASGSERTRFVTVKVCFPIRGSDRIEIKLIPSCGEYQNSRSTVTLRSFPNTPGLKMVESRVPVVSTPKINCFPRFSWSTVPASSGRGPGGGPSILYTAVVDGA